MWGHIDKACGVDDGMLNCASVESSEGPTCGYAWLVWGVSSSKAVYRA